MNMVNQPSLYFALSFVGMFICAWLFDRAQKRYLPDAGDKPESAKPSLLRALLYMASAIAGAITLWLALYKTSLVVADALLVTALVCAAVGSYRIRLRPLLAHGLTRPHLALLVAALCLWGVPILWFMHLHLAASYGAA